MSATITEVSSELPAQALDITTRERCATTLPNHGNVLVDDIELFQADSSSSTYQIQNAGRSLEQFTVESGNPPSPPAPELSTARTFLIIASLTGIFFSNSMSTGLFTIGLPSIAKDLDLAENLLLWPASVCSLASGCTLLLSASISDAVGPRRINVLGCFLLGILILACGLARTGIQLILLRAFQGVAVSMCFPTAVSILTNSFPHGRKRNIAFSCLGFGSHLGWAFGMLLAGVFETGSKPLGWRAGFYLTAAATVFISAMNFWKLPNDPTRERMTWNQFRRSVDWVGLILSSGCLGIFSYIFAIFTGGVTAIRQTSSIILVSIATAMIPAFIFWMHRQETRSKPALIPNSIWRTKAFTAICIMVLLSWAVLISMELFMSLYSGFPHGSRLMLQSILLISISFQQVQQVSVFQTALRFLPNIAFGIIMNLGVGLLVHRFRPNYLILVTSVITALSPLLMAIIDPSWSWWYASFWAVLLGPLSAAVIYTIANLIIVDMFPPHTQALAGAVFNTVSQFGSSIGTALSAVIAASVTSGSEFEPKNSPQALMAGYRAVYWACFASTVLVCGIGALGLRKVGKVGMKVD